MKEKIIITGGSGFIGTNLVEFYKENYQVLNIDILPPRKPDQTGYWTCCDILNEDHLSTIFREFSPKYVFHMAAKTDLDGKTISEYDANITGVRNVISALKKTSTVRKVIFASSRLVCEIGYQPIDELDYKPTTLYGESKIIGEKIVRESEINDFDWLIVRPTSLWGPWFSVPYRNFFDSIYKKRYMHPKGIEVYKKFGYIGNSIYILNKLLFIDIFNKKTIYLSDFKDLEVKHWANMISHSFHKVDVGEIPIRILEVVANICDLLKKMGYKNPPLTKFRLDNLITDMPYDTLEIEKEIGELPFNLKEATIATCQWYKTFCDVSKS